MDINDTQLIGILLIATAIGYGLHKNRKYFFGIGFTDLEIDCKNDYLKLKDRIDATIKFNQVHQLEQEIASFAHDYDNTVDRMLLQKYWTTLVHRAEIRKKRLSPSTFGGFY